MRNFCSTIWIHLCKILIQIKNIRHRKHTRWPWKRKDNGLSPETLLCAKISEIKHRTFFSFPTYQYFTSVIVENVFSTFPTTHFLREVCLLLWQDFEYLVCSAVWKNNGGETESTRVFISVSNNALRLYLHR